MYAGHPGGVEMKSRTGPSFVVALVLAAGGIARGTEIENKNYKEKKI